MAIISGTRYVARVVLLSLLCILSARVSVAADGPFPVPKGWENDGELLLTGENPSRRGNFCARQKEVAIGTIPLRDALMGMNISVMVNLMEWGPWHGHFGVCDEKRDAGCVFHGAIMDELSKRAGFFYKDTFAIGDSQNAENFKAWMLWVARNYDVGIGIATETADRLADGLVWSAYLTDNSFVLATRPVVEDADVLATLFLFVTPFSWQVWALLFSGGFLSSLLYVATERHANPEDLPEGTFWQQVGDAFMLALFQFTGSGGFTPKTAAGRGITFTWGFTTFLTIAAYTANLASFLISKDQTGFQLTTIDEANSAGAKVCHRRGWAIERYLAEHYPRVGRVPTDSQAEVWEHLRDGKCVAEALFLSGFRVEEVKNGYNPLCELELTPALPFSSQSGGWFSQSDNGFLCTGLVKDVLQLHMSEMVVEGRVEMYFQDHIDVGAASDPRQRPCEKKEDEKVGARQQMGIASMGGVYIVHAVLTVLAALTILEICIWNKTHHGTEHDHEANRHRAGVEQEEGLTSSSTVQLVYPPSPYPEAGMTPRSEMAKRAADSNKCGGGGVCGCADLRARVQEIASGGDALNERLDRMSMEHDKRFEELQRLLNLQLQMLSALTGAQAGAQHRGSHDVNNLKPGGTAAGRELAQPALRPLEGHTGLPQVNSSSFMMGSDTTTTTTVDLVGIEGGTFPERDSQAQLNAQLAAGRCANRAPSASDSAGHASDAPPNHAAALYSPRHAEAEVTVAAPASVRRHGSEVAGAAWSSL